MNNMVRILALFWMLLSIAQATFGQSMRASAGTLDSFMIHSPRFGKRSIYVWLPSTANTHVSTDQIGGRLSVLYMHDGQMLFDKKVTWNGKEWHVDEHMDALITQGIIPPTMVVGIPNGGSNRHREYFPQKPLELLSSDEKETLLAAQRPDGQYIFSGPVCSDDYVAFLVDELKPYIIAHYEVHADKSAHFLMGSSMGGLISLYALCEYPDEFGGAACLSTHWPGTFDLNDSNPFPPAMRSYLQARIPLLDTHTLYFDYGTETLDAYYEKDQKLVDALMSNLAPIDLRWITRKWEGEAHTEEAWSKRFSEIARWMWGK